MNEEVIWSCTAVCLLCCCSQLSLSAVVAVPACEHQKLLQRHREHSLQSWFDIKATHRSIELSKNGSCLAGHNLLSCKRDHLSGAGTLQVGFRHYTSSHTLSVHYGFSAVRRVLPAINPSGYIDSFASTNSRATRLEPAFSSVLTPFPHPGRARLLQMSRYSGYHRVSSEQSFLA